MANVITNKINTTNIREEKESFYDDYKSFLNKLKIIEATTAWEEKDSLFTEFSVLDDNNPFPSFGGDEFGIQVSFDAGNTKYQLRDTSLSTILARCDVSGKGVTKLLEADKELFCTHINDYLKLKSTSRKNLLVLIQAGKVSAMHSTNYTPIPMVKIFEAVADYLNERFDKTDFLSGHWSWEGSTVLYQIKDNYVLDLYKENLSKYIPNINDASLLLRVTSSDVSLSAVNITPFIKFNHKLLPLGGRTATKHVGKVDISTVENGLDSSFVHFEAACKNLAAYSEIKIQNKKNAMIKAFSWLLIPQKHCAELCERYENTEASALEIYIDMCEVLDIMKHNNVSADTLIQYEERISKMVTINHNKWSSFDVPGVVAWNARNN